MEYHVFLPMPYAYVVMKDYVKDYYPKGYRYYTYIPKEATWLDK